MSEYNDCEIVMPEEFGWSARQDFKRSHGSELGKSRFILNFSQTRKIDASGLGLLLQLSDLLAGESGRLHLVLARGQVLAALKAAGLDSVASFEYPSISA